MDHRSSLSRAGFTLLELLLVLLLLGMIASAVAVQLDGPLRRTRVNNAAERWLAIDQFVRISTMHRSASLALIRVNDRWEAIATRTSGDIIGHWQFDPRIDLQLIFMSPVTVLNKSQSSKQILFEPGRGSQDYRIQIRDKGISRDVLIAGGTGEDKTI